ncbi:conserved hypothetical protein [Acidovorax delafieldii 2AN]|uniref:Uncharacterized protein n=1 Tax=Acidovorax delafieldii 2AN TaxID=573060 RepID=C5T647_ACIDE|nr:conserved hypothetical protein [Acidovorax delafieldii 2AN]
MNTTLRHLMSGAAAALLAATAAGAHAQSYVNATVGGQLAPGVYGRIDIGNAPPPPLLYAEPVIIQRPAVMVPRSPIYLYVPPGHAKNWGKHCARYNACGQPVYFVKEPPRGPAYGGRPDYRNGRDDRHWDDGHRGGKHNRGEGRGEGRGRGHGHRD